MFDCIDPENNYSKSCRNVVDVNKVSKGAKIRNRYNQVPHLTQDTNGKVTNSQQTPQTRAKRSALSQQDSDETVIVESVFYSERFKQNRGRI